MSYSRIGVVTGANKGIGYAIVRQLALQYPTSPTNAGPLLIYLTSRDQSRGEAALQSLQQDSQLKEAKALASDGGVAEIKYHALDITEEDSVGKFVKHLREKHEGGIDFVINNAGIALNGFDIDVVKKTLGCNYYNTLSACHAFLPLLKPHGRIVNVASTGGKLNIFSPTIRNRFLASKTESDVDALMQEFTAAVEAGTQSEAGFPSAAYATSKAGLIAGTRALARTEKEKGGTVLINSCCPGYVATDMSKHNGTLTPDQGAQTPVMLALKDINGETGEFWKDLKHEEW
ncbi:carbonyl reductase [Aaosphaeria arxii CBS 175.79]|uniref:Carbonyl reductase n=1 Tax=Aaosphaeria arxii CBS 175.79 TaxID=1450172 RepID=A0A6A5XVK7_9PLEO|nr:carbonyl reductase [Aaosphaeria arxii CBS 175.79]KAF2016976.1 carbonyl reductase [Aaosphaeria arxii CBS 175.79]